MSVSRTRRVISPIPNTSRPASGLITTDEPKTVMPAAHSASSTATGTPNQSGRNTSATTAPMTAMTTVLTRSTVGHRQR